MILNNQKIAVLGFSPRTGLELVRYLLKKNVEIIISDSKTKAELSDLIKKVENDKISFAFSSQTDRILEADLIILSPGVPYDLEILKKARANNIETISEIEFAYRQSQAEIIAITGTNGKTTTTELLKAMLSDYKNKEIKAAGNIGIPFISIVDQLEKGETLILELSSFQLEAVKEFKAKIALYLNYSPDHLDRHHSEKNYKKAKKNIFLNQNKSDFALLNFDDPYLFNLKNELEAEVLGIGSRAENIDLIVSEKEVFYKKDNVKLVDFSKVKLIGKHNKFNIAFAALAAYLLGQDINKIQQAAENFKVQNHRMEVVQNKKDFLIINDSKATNPESTLNAINSIEKDLILIAGGQDREADFSKLAKVIQKKVKILILIGETAVKIESLLKKSISLNSDRLEIIKVKDLKTAVKIAVQKMTKNEALLLSPAAPSWDMFSNYKERGEVFKKNVLKLIN